MVLMIRSLTTDDISIETTTRIEPRYPIISTIFLALLDLIIPPNHKIRNRKRKVRFMGLFLLYTEATIQERSKTLWSIILYG
jgi:hypothetical protein